jgi:hypothetical protein
MILDGADIAIITIDICIIIDACDEEEKRSLKKVGILSIWCMRGLEPT